MRSGRVGGRTGFYSAEDADSEGEEGKFYVWSYDEIMQVLGPDDGPVFARAFNIRKEGNFNDEATGRTTGMNIPHLERNSAFYGPAVDPGLRRRIDRAREKLLLVRAQRVRPLLDDKVITAWNGLMIAALARGGRVLGDETYTRAARKAAAFIFTTLRSADGRLLRRFRRGRAGIPAFVDDYAFLTWGLLELYETTFDPDYLDRALNLTTAMTELFWDEKAGGFFFSGTGNEKLLVPAKDIYDGALPSGNSVAMQNLLRLSRMTGRTDLEQRAERLVRAFGGEIRNAPTAYTQFLSAADMMIGPSREIVIVGDPRTPETRALINTVRSTYLPRSVVLLREPGPRGRALEKIAGHVKYQTPVDGKPAVYVCERFTCKEPVTDPAELKRLLAGRG